MSERVEGVPERERLAAWCAGIASRLREGPLTLDVDRVGRFEDIAALLRSPSRVRLTAEDVASAMRRALGLEEYPIVELSTENAGDVAHELNLILDAKEGGQRDG